MDEVFLTGAQALQLIALLPCLCAPILLFFIRENWQSVLVPALFFLSLASSFAQGILVIWPTVSPSVLHGLLWLETLQPSFIFLLVLQLWKGAVPKSPYWLILALPILGGSSLVYASFELDEACVAGSYCLQAEAFRALYHLFATSLILLLLVTHLFGTPIAFSQRELYRSHRYWLIISLIVSMLALLMTDLLWLIEELSWQEHRLIQLVIRTLFVYLVITSVFRVFDRPPPVAPEEETAQTRPVDPAVLERIEQAMREEHLYREMGFSRERCAQKLDIPDHVLSRAINQSFGKNFNEYVNGFRIEEAKQRLRQETTSITAIAFEVGFSSIASFNRVFKSMVGYSPTAYRSEKQE